MLERLQNVIDHPNRFPPGDVISIILSLLSPSFCTSARVFTGGDWWVDFPPTARPKLIAGELGSCWLVVEGARARIRVETGDCYLVKGGHAYRQASDLSLEAIN